MRFEDALAAHVMAGLERQETARGVIEGRSARVNPGAGIYAITGAATLSADVLGSIAGDTLTWIWENPAPGLDDAALAPGRRLRDRARELDVAVFLDGPLSVTEVSVEPLAHVAVGLLGADAFVVWAAADGPQILLALRSPALAMPVLTGGLLTQTVTAALGVLDLDLPHQAMIAPYLRGRGAEVDPDGTAWRVTLPSEERLTLHFDDAGRLADIERPAPVTVTGTLSLKRPGGRWRDRATAYRVLVDAGDMAQIEPGGTVELPLPVGTHDVQFAAGESLSPTIPVLVREGTSVGLLCGPRPGRQVGTDPESRIAIELLES